MRSISMVISTSRCAGTAWRSTSTEDQQIHLVPLPVGVTELEVRPSSVRPDTWKQLAAESGIAFLHYGWAVLVAQIGAPSGR